MRKGIIFGIIGIIVLIIFSSNPSIRAFDIKGQSQSNLTELQEYGSIRIFTDEDLRNQSRIENWDLNGTRDGSPNKPFLISNLLITNTSDRLIWIEETSLYLSIENCTLIGGTTGISLWNTYNVIISGNHILHNSVGIDLQGYNSTISHNFISENEYGINLFGRANAYIFENDIFKNQWKGIGIEDFDQVKIVRNKIHENGEGLEFLMYTRGTLVFDNEIYDNTLNGIFLGDNFLVNITYNRIYQNTLNGIQYEFAFGGSLINWNYIFDNGFNGLEVFLASNFQIINNSIENHQQNGIFLGEDCHNLTIQGNNISLSGGYGLILSGSAINNTLVFNNFVDNSLPSSSQSFDSGFLNNFSHNFWSDWTSPNDDGDLFIDFPYAIDGESGNFDPFPLAYPFSSTYGLTPRDTDSDSLTESNNTDTTALLTQGFLFPSIFLVMVISYLEKRKRIGK